MNQPACNAMRSIAGREATGNAYLECIRMLNGLEKSLERRLPENELRWAVAKTADKHGEPNTCIAFHNPRNANHA